MHGFSLSFSAKIILADNIQIYFQKHECYNEQVTCINLRVIIFDDELAKPKKHEREREGGRTSAAQVEFLLFLQHAP